MGRGLTFGQKAAMVFATGFGAGYVPLAPGTAGALVGLLVGWGLSLLAPWASLPLLMLLTIFGCIVSGITEKAVDQKDPGIVVIDEIIGMAVSMWNMDLSWICLAGLFFLFRLFDIWKPFPVKQIEDLFEGGTGIVLDDVMAGILANIIWRIGGLFFV